MRRAKFVGSQQTKIIHQTLIPLWYYRRVGGTSRGPGGMSVRKARVHAVAVRCPDIDPSDATALGAEVREPLSASADGSPRISSTSPAVRCEDRGPGRRLRTTINAPSKEHLLDVVSLHDTPFRQEHSMPGCGGVIGRLTTLRSAEFSIAHSTTHLGPKFPFFVIAFGAAKPAKFCSGHCGPAGTRERRQRGACPDASTEQGLCRSRRSDT